MTMPHYGGSIDLKDANDPRTRIVNWVPAGSHVLEIGCGSGTIIGYLAQFKNCRALAVERDAAMAEEARSTGVSVLEGSIDCPPMQQALVVRCPFDIIIFADVLEHLADPWAVLRNVRKLLGPEGCILISLPNVAHWTVRLGLLSGRFEYTDGFLMDRTHLRFFTLKTAQQMFANSGYRIAGLQVRWAPLPGDRVWRRVPFLRNSINELLARVLPGLYGYQFVFKLGRGADDRTT